MHSFMLNIVYANSNDFRMNRRELEKKVNGIAEGLRYEKGYVCPVDLLKELGYLSREDYENWRFGRIHYLEKVCMVNLPKLNLILRKLKAYADSRDLKPSWTAYKKWGKGKKIWLRFSKSGDENIERAYATHYVDVPRIEKLKEKKNEIAKKTQGKK